MRRSPAAILLATLLAACGLAASPSATPASIVPGTVNIVREAGLADTKRIELYEMTEGGYLFRAAITSPADVGAVMAALDRPVELTPRVRCPDRFHAHFVGPAGSRVVLGLVCADLPEAIRGAQAFWRGQDARVPDDAARVIADAVARSPAPASLAADAAVGQVVGRLSSSIPGADAYAVYDWRRVDVNRSTALGRPEHWLYVSAEWLVEVSWLPSPAPAFEVWVTVPAAGLTWHGQGQAGAIVEASVGP